jgi:heat shock protein 4
VLFVDLGHSKLSLTTVGFTREKIAVVCQHNERNLGCRDMDYLVLQFYREVFKKQSNGLDLIQNKKAFIKMIETIEKQRKVLSANS